AAASADERDVIQQLQDGCDQTCDISQRGGIEHAVDTALLFFGLNDPTVSEQSLRPGRCVKFHRQGSQREDGTAREDQYAKPCDLRQLQEQTDHNENPTEVRADINQRHKRGTELQREVFLSILLGMTQFMRSN